MISIQKHQQISPCARAAAKFFSSKITGTLKMNIGRNFPFHKRTIVKIKILNLNLFSILFYFSKMTKMVFDLKNSKQNSF